MVSSSPFRLWRPGCLIPEHGVHFVIGVATWSGYDMRLLDAIAEALQPDPSDPSVIDVFNTADCRNAEDFAGRVPGLNEVAQTPVMGFWNNGELQYRVHGHAARDGIVGIFGLRSSEIVAFVQDWIASRQQVS